MIKIQDCNYEMLCSSAPIREKKFNVEIRYSPKEWIVDMTNFNWCCSPRSRGCIEVPLDIEKRIIEKFQNDLLHDELARVLNMPSQCTSQGLLDQVQRMRKDLRDYRDWFQSVVSPDGVINGYWKEDSE